MSSSSSKWQSVDVWRKDSDHVTSRTTNPFPKLGQARPGTASSAAMEFLALETLPTEGELKLRALLRIQEEEFRAKLQAQEERIHELEAALAAQKAPRRSSGPRGRLCRERHRDL